METQETVSQRFAGAALAALIAGPCGVAPALAQHVEETALTVGDGWAVTIAPYLWATALDGDASVRGVEADVDLPFSDIIKDLSLGVMMAVDIEKDRLGIGVKGLFARVSPDGDVGPFEIDVTSDIAQLAVAPYYRLIEWHYGVSSSGRPLRFFVAPEAGVRFTYLRTELEVRGGRTVDGDQSWIEPLIGSRVGLDLTDHWTIVGEGNVGGFGIGSDFAWNLQAVVGYRTSLFGRSTLLALGYRALHQDYDHNDSNGT